MAWTDGRKKLVMISRFRDSNLGPFEYQAPTATFTSTGVPLEVAVTVLVLGLFSLRKCGRFHDPERQQHAATSVLDSSGWPPRRYIKGRLSKEQRRSLGLVWLL